MPIGFEKLLLISTAANSFIEGVGTIKDSVPELDIGVISCIAVMSDTSHICVEPVAPLMSNSLICPAPADAMLLKSIEPPVKVKALLAFRTKLYMYPKELPEASGLLKVYVREKLPEGAVNVPVCEPTS